MCSIFAGRKKQLEKLDEVLEKEKGILVIVGESGIGKTELIKQFSQRLENRGDIFIGLHECQFAEEGKDPYLAVLGNLVRHAESKLEQNALKKAFGGVGAAFRGIIQRRGELGRAILKDLWARTGLGDNTLNLFGEVWKETKDAKIGISLVGEELKKYQQPFIQTYLEIFQALRDGFSQNKFVVMLDQFERVDMFSENIFLDFAMGIPESVFLIISFKLAEQVKPGEDVTLLEKYKAIKSWLMEAGAEIVELSGLSWGEMREWIEARWSKRLTRPELERIRKASGGFPNILEKWIESPKLDVRDLETREYLNGSYKSSIDALRRETRDFAYRLSVLLGPLSLEDYARLLRLAGRKIEDWQCHDMIRELEAHLIFEEDDMPWFRHERIKHFVEKHMGTELGTKYHQAAAKFFEEEAEKWA